ncbi:hypothetical protein AVEN_107270-1 [Araneus ventricosus]|uniref:Uncharacterized protein n=1 Tax=Araneus ventricosus TaxID=182803 RepID=A0A4Y2AY01_ARAVE|nr:hypothetical protein AVEN_160711-1 [Araneus ventricosus]GBO43585.1 hypothetical protein AVEN_107270-1 [Araneus ventricosus]
MHSDYPITNTHSDWPITNTHSDWPVTYAHSDWPITNTHSDWPITNTHSDWPITSTHSDWPVTNLNSLCEMHIKLVMHDCFSQSKSIYCQSLQSPTSTISSLNHVPQVPPTHESSPAGVHLWPSSQKWIDKYYVGLDILYSTPSIHDFHLLCQF